MLIDFLTARLSYEHLAPETWQELRRHGDRIMKYDPRTGAIDWEISSWNSVRSDSHSVSFRVTADTIQIKGSPARCIGDGDAVFGSGASRSLHLVGCLRHMAATVSQALGVELPTDPKLWKVSRVDVTGNLLLDSLSAVRVALSLLRNCEGGRYRVSQKAGDTVYWGGKSRRKKAKAYAKGPHIRFQAKQRQYTGRPYTDSEVEYLDRILRLELTLGPQWFRDTVGCPWYEIKSETLASEWQTYFGKMIGGAEMEVDEQSLEQKIIAAAKTEAQGKAAYCCWLVIQSKGWQKARESFPRRTWYHHLKTIHAAGLRDLDISTGAVVPLRRKVLEFQVVNSFSELMQLQKVA